MQNSQTKYFINCSVENNADNLWKIKIRICSNTQNEGVQRKKAGTICGYGPDRNRLVEGSC